MSIHRTKNRKKTVSVKTINIGIIDRMFRFNLGFAILLLSVVSLQISSAVPVWIDESTTMPMWAYIAILGSVYPIITGIFGYDPIYSIFKKDTLESFLPRDAYTHSETITDKSENLKNKNSTLAHNS